MLESALRTVKGSKNSKSKQPFAIARELVAVRKALYDDVPSVSNTHKLALALSRFASCAAEYSVDAPVWEEERLDALKYSSDLYAVLCGHDSSYRLERADALWALSRERLLSAVKQDMVPMKVVEDDAKVAVDMFKDLKRHAGRLPLSLVNLSTIQSERDEHREALQTALEAVNLLPKGQIKDKSIHRKIYLRASDCYGDLGQKKEQKEYANKAKECS
jgi:hypothetical protein